MALFFFSSKYCLANRAVAQLVEGATHGEEVPGSIPAAADDSLLVGSMSVYNVIG